MGNYKNHTTLRVGTDVMVEGEFAGRVKEVWGENKFYVGYFNHKSRRIEESFFEAHELVIAKESPINIDIDKYKRLFKKQVRIENAVNIPFPKGSFIFTKDHGYNGEITEILDHDLYKIRYWKSTHPKEVAETSVLHESEIIYKRGPLTDVEKEKNLKQ